jgi:hypothetical protein
MERQNMKKETLTDRLVKAYQEEDYSAAWYLMDGFTSGKLKAAYAAVLRVEGYTAYCQAKRGESTKMKEFLGI